MIDSRKEQLLTLSAAARDIPNRNSGRGVNVSTVWRWTLRGIRGVKLDTILVGGIRYTSREAMQRFFEATTAVANGHTAPVRTSNERQRQIEAAERELKEVGI